MPSQPVAGANITLCLTNMVASYITTGNKHKMTVPNKATALRGSMDACPNTTLGMTAQTVSEEYPYKRAPCQSTETQTAPKFSGATGKDLANTSTEDMLKPCSTKTIFAVYCCAHAFIHCDSQ